jgi:hypothetical protein
VRVAVVVQLGKTLLRVLDLDNEVRESIGIDLFKMGEEHIALASGFDPKSAKCIVSGSISVTANVAHPRIAAEIAPRSL